MVSAKADVKVNSFYDGKSSLLTYDDFAFDDSDMEDIIDIIEDQTESSGKVANESLDTITARNGVTVSNISKVGTSASPTTNTVPCSSSSSSDYSSGSYSSNQKDNQDSSVEFAGQDYPHSKELYKVNVVYFTHSVFLY